MSAKIYASQTERSAPTCALCGQKLGIKFYFTCHACGLSYCYAHMPIKCTHKASLRPEQVLLARTESQDGV